jgi:hypothetical protein
MLSASVDLDVDVTAEDVYQAHRKRVKQAANLGFSVSQERVPVDTGTLKQSGFAPEFREEDVVFGYTARQAAPMEYGTEPGHRPPIQPLVRWAQRIGKDPGFGVWVATQKIPQEGVDASPYLAPAAERMKPWLDNHGLDL